MLGRLLRADSQRSHKRGFSGAEEKRQAQSKAQGDRPAAAQSEIDRAQSTHAPTPQPKKTAARRVTGKGLFFARRARHRASRHRASRARNQASAYGIGKPLINAS